MQKIALNDLVIFKDNKSANYKLVMLDRESQRAYSLVLTPDSKSCDIGKIIKRKEDSFKTRPLRSIFFDQYIFNFYNEIERMNLQIQLNIVAEWIKLLDEPEIKDLLDNYFASNYDQNLNKSIIRNVFFKSLEQNKMIELINPSENIEVDKNFE